MTSMGTTKNLNVSMGSQSRYNEEAGSEGYNSGNVNVPINSEQKFSENVTSA